MMLFWLLVKMEGYFLRKRTKKYPGLRKSVLDISKYGEYNYKELFNRLRKQYYKL